MKRTTAVSKCYVSCNVISTMNPLRWKSGKWHNITAALFVYFVKMCQITCSCTTVPSRANGGTVQAVQQYLVPAKLHCSTVLGNGYFHITVKWSFNYYKGHHFIIPHLTVYWICVMHSVFNPYVLSNYEWCIQHLLK